MKLDRSAGILLHPTSLPGDGGIGDLGAAPARFLDWAAAAGFAVWQVLPLGPTTRGNCNSPYACPSAFAGNPLLISMARLEEEGCLPAGAGAAESAPPPRVDYDQVIPWKRRLLRESFDHVRRAGPAEIRRDLESFVDDPAQAGWLEDWALFSALKERYEGRWWVEWDADIRRREPSALVRTRAEFGESIEFHRYVQFQFFRQWDRVREQAHARGIRILGDAPIYVAHDSADVWASPQYFMLRKSGRPEFVAGVPPDYFSDTGQLWGNPIYEWKHLARDGYAWWIDRVRANLRLVDSLRLDHFRGFVAYWRVPAREKTAMRGRWIRGPGIKLFRALEEAFGDLPFVAEDLGVITPPVRRLKTELGLPGMKVLQFGFNGSRNPHHPDRIEPGDVVYTGTHDNDTTRGWFAGLDEKERARVCAILESDGAHIEWDLIETAYRSSAALAMLPLQDALGLDTDARMNTPAISGGNWGWRVEEAQLTDAVAARLRDLAAATSRISESR